MESKEAIEKFDKKWNTLLALSIIATAAFITCSILESTTITRLIMIISGSIICWLGVFVIFDHFLSDDIL